MFITPLDVRILGEQKFYLLDSLIYKDNEYTIEILKGFIFDGGSIPSLFRSIECPIGGVGSRAFCLHDILYGTQLLDRYASDRLLYKALIEEGMDRIIAIPIYLAVRAGGSSAYNKIDNTNMYWDFVKIKRNKIEDRI